MALGTSQRWQNPPENGGASVAAGSTIELSYSVSNSSGEKPIEYSVLIDGLPAEWTTDNPSRRTIAPFSDGEAVIPITPDYETGPQVVSFTVMLRRRSTDEWPAPRKLSLKITAPTGPKPQPAVEPVVEAIPIPQPEPARVAPPTAVVVEDTQVTAPQPTPAPTPEPVAQSAPAPPVEPIVEPVARVETPVEVAPPIESPVEPAVKAEPVVEAKPEPPAPEEPKFVKEAPKRVSGTMRKPTPPPEPQREPDPEPEPEPVAQRQPDAQPEPVMRVVDDFQAAPAWQPEETPEPSFVASDRTVVDPKDGSIIQARPGERVLVKFSFEYPAARGVPAGSRMYILQEDGTLPRKWIDLVVDQISVLPNATGEVSMLLTPPLDADPAGYPFSVQIGPLGQPLDNCNLVLEVQPLPAVALAADGAPPKVWIRAQIPLAVIVSTAGNAETAYRLAVRAPEAEDEVPVGKLPPEISETPTWRYLIERELGSLESPVTSQRPPAQPHKLWLRRKGIWWFGFKESHTFKLAAVPVTDPRNGQKPGNTVVLVGTRYRPWPIPLFFLIPLLFVLWVLLFQGAHDLVVTNAISGGSDHLYVVGKSFADLTSSTSVPVELKWEKGILPASVARTETGSTSTTSISGMSDNVDLGTGYHKDLQYKLGGDTENVTVVGLRTNHVLLIANGTDGKTFDPTVFNAKPGSAPQEMGKTIEVPSNGAVYVAFGNTDRTRADHVELFELSKPDVSKFVLSNFMQAGQNSLTLENGAPKTAKIVATGKPGDTATWKLVSTDAAYPIINITFKIAGAQ